MGPVVAGVGDAPLGDTRCSHEAHELDEAEDAEHAQHHQALERVVCAHRDNVKNGDQH